MLYLLNMPSIKTLSNFYNEIFKSPITIDTEKFHMSSEPGLNRLKDYFWTKKCSMETMEKWRDLGGASPLGIFWRGLAFSPKMRPFYDLFDFYMTKKQIKFIQSLRNENSSITNRALATAFRREFPKSNIEESCAYDGRWLSLYAYELTGDKNLDC